MTVFAFSAKTFNMFFPSSSQRVFSICCIVLLMINIGLAKTNHHSKEKSRSEHTSRIYEAKSKSRSSSSSSSSSSSGSSSDSNSVSGDSASYQTKSTTIPRGYVDGRLCNRPCNGNRMSCFFSFDMETFYAMSKACYNCATNRTDCFRQDCIVAGGIGRTVQVINRQLPGPAIEVCQYDEVMVYVQNNLQDAEGTTIHWHGQHMIRDKYMDGVPWVTQCPIHYNNNFTYELWADDAGTYWWHSHVEMQRGDGVFGAFIVRQTPSRNYHYSRYDFDLSEHVIMAGDWNDRLRIDVFEAYALAGAWLEPTGILVNGLGRQSSSNVTDTPTAVFNVQRGRRYRFRFINVGFFDCPLEFSIDGHKMLIISTDSQDLQPREVDSFVSSSGERFDFVLNANQAVSTYYIRVKGYLTCERTGVYTTATLRYQGSANPEPTGTYPTYVNAAPTGGVLYNPVSKTNATNYQQVLSIHEIKAMASLESGLQYPSSSNLYRFYITVDMSALDHPVFHRFPYYTFEGVDPNMRARTPQFNRISHKNLDVPLLPARFQINQAAFCNEATMRNSNCENSFCECPHVLSVPTNAIVEFVFIELFDQDDSPALHPIHLHGYSFRVLGWGELGRNITREDVIAMDRRGELIRDFTNPPLKDTVSVPKGGYTIVRFKADNPGYWLMHCHIDIHASEGMDLVLKVGENNAMPPVPDYFPTCGNWPRY